MREPALSTAAVALPVAAQATADEVVIGKKCLTADVGEQAVEKRRVSLWLAPFSKALTGKRDAYPTFFNRQLSRSAE